MNGWGAAQRLLVVALGIWVGWCGAITHRMSHDVGPLDLPWGLVLALGVAGVLAWVCDSLVRAGAAWFGLGWTLVLLVQQGFARGSVLVANDVLGWTFMLGGLVILAVAAFGAPRARRRRFTAPSSLER